MTHRVDTILGKRNGNEVELCLRLVTTPSGLPQGLQTARL